MEARKNSKSFPLCQTGENMEVHQATLLFKWLFWLNDPEAQDCVNYVA